MQQVYSKLDSASGRVLVLAIFAFIVCLRMPEILITGRFWAEEGTLAFHNAWTMPPLRAMFVPMAGYLNLVANGATVAGRWLLPLSAAPYLTITVGLLFQLMAPLLLLTARDAWLKPPVVRLASVLLILLVPSSEDIWLHSLSCQFQLTLCAAIILALEPASGRVGAFRLVLLALGPLCGPGAIVLVPLFVLRALLDRSPRRIAEMLTLGAASAIQLLFFYQPFGLRTYALHPVIITAMMTTRHIATPFLGNPYGQEVAEVIRSSIGGGHVPWISVLVATTFFGALGLAAVLRGLRAPAIWLLAAGAVSDVIGYVGALDGGIKMLSPRWGDRYLFVSEAVYTLAILALRFRQAGTTPSAPAREPARGHRFGQFVTGMHLRLKIDQRLYWITRVAVAWLLVIGATGFFFTASVYSDGPAWRAEVAAWRADPAHLLEIWPRGWRLELNARR